MKWYHWPILICMAVAMFAINVAGFYNDRGPDDTRVLRLIGSMMVGVFWVALLFYLGLRAERRISS